MAKFDVFYKGNKTIVEASDMWNAKLKGVDFFNVPKRHMNLLSIQSSRSVKEEDFRYM